MSRPTNYRLRETIRQLTDVHAVFIGQFERLIRVLHEELESAGLDHWESLSSLAAKQSIPHLDRTQWSVVFRGRSCRLGNSVLFRLLEYLLRRPNRDISHDQLLNDVWQHKVSASALRAGIKNLRKRLRQSGMAAVARAIQGRTVRHYSFVVAQIS